MTVNGPWRICFEFRTSSRAATEQRPLGTENQMRERALRFVGRRLRWDDLGRLDAESPCKLTPA